MAQSTVTTKPTLKITRTYAAPREKVFRAWTDSEVMKKWFAPSNDFTVPEVQVDAKVGGRYRIVMRSPDGEYHRVGGVYREVLPPQKLVFTWAWESTPERESLVTIELKDLGKTTELVLTHERFADEEARDKHQQGWNGCLNRLAGFLS